MSSLKSDQRAVTHKFATRHRTGSFFIPVSEELKRFGADSFAASAPKKQNKKILSIETIVP